jgi:hypothetical protein
MLENLLYLHCYVKKYTTMKLVTWERQKVINDKPKTFQKLGTPAQVALAAVFAALFAVVSIIPAIPTPVPGLTISIAALIATIFGLVLGPYLGGASALVGSIVAWAITGGSPYGLPFILSPMFNAVISGFIFYRRWKYAFAIFGVMVIAFLFTPAVSPITGVSTIAGIGNWWLAVAVLFDKVIALFLILPVAFFAKKMSVGQGAALFLIIGFIGNQADNMWGSFIYSFPIVYNSIFGYTLEAVQASFLVSPFFYPAVRLVEAFFVMVISIPLIELLQKNSWLWSKDSILTHKQPKLETTQSPKP